MRFVPTLQPADREPKLQLFSRSNIGNIHAPVNTRAQAVATSVCSTGLQNPADSACGTANDVHFIQLHDTLSRPRLQHPQNVQLTERVGFELRGEFFNITNNQNFDTPSPNRNVSTNNGTNFPNTSLLNGGSRTMRVGGKIKS